MVKQPLVSSSQLPLVTVVVVNYNGGSRLHQCLQALLDSSYPCREFLVVDNASTDGSPAILRDFAIDYPEITALWSSSNIGYAGAINLALASARGVYVAVMNMDIVVDREWLQPLISFLADHPQTGAVNPLILLSDGQRVNA